MALSSLFLASLDPRFRRKLEELYRRARAAGLDFSLVSGKRTKEQQEAVARKYAEQPGRAAKPGSSPHEFGLAVDVRMVKGSLEKLGQIAKSVGMRWGGEFKKFVEPWHLDLFSPGIAQAAGVDPIAAKYAGKAPKIDPIAAKYAEPAAIDPIAAKYAGKQPTILAEPSIDPIAEVFMIRGKKAIDRFFRQIGAQKEFPSRWPQPSEYKTPAGKIFAGGMVGMTALGVGAYWAPGAAKEIVRNLVSGETTTPWDVLKGIGEGERKAMSWGEALYESPGWRRFAEADPTAAGVIIGAMDVGLDLGWFLGLPVIKTIGKPVVGLGAKVVEGIGVARGLQKVAGKAGQAAETLATKLHLAPVAKAERQARQAIYQPQRLFVQKAGAESELSLRAMQKVVYEQDKFRPKTIGKWAWRDAYWDDVARVYDAKMDATKTLMAELGEAAIKNKPTIEAAALGAQREVLEQVAAAGRNPNVVKRLMAMREVQETKNAKMLVEAGLLSPELADLYKGKHLLRQFQLHHDPGKILSEIREIDPIRAARIEGEMRRGTAYASTGGIPAALRHQRQLLDESYINQMKLLHPRERMAYGDLIAATASSRSKMYREFSAKYGLTAAEAEALMKESKSIRYKPIPRTERWAELGDRPETWLPQDIAERITNTHWVDNFLRWGRGNPIGELYFEFAVPIWKVMHTALNIPTATRNAVTNTMLAHLVGKVPVWQLPQRFINGALHVIRRDEVWQEAMGAFPGMRSGFGRLELRAGGPGWGRVKNPADALKWLWRQSGGRGAEFYGNVEEVAKMAVYDYWRVGKKMNPAEAGELAVKAIFDYGDVDKVTEVLRRTGVVPFITYPRKALPALLEAGLEKPARLAAYQKVLGPRGMIESMYPDQEKLERERRVLPEWMKGAAVRLPSERLGWQPYMFYMPYGPMADVPGAFAPTTTLFGPLAQQAQELMSNRATWPYPREIWPEGAPSQVKALEGLRYFFGQNVPRWLYPGVGRIAGAIAKEPTPRAGRWPPQPARGVPEVAAGELVGFRTYQIDTPYERYRRTMELQGEIREIEAYIRSVQKDMRDGKIDKERGIAIINERVQKIRGIVAEIRRL